MKRLLAALLFASLSVISFSQTAAQPGADTVATAPPPAHSATAEQIRAYFELVHMDKTVHGAMEQMLRRQGRRLRRIFRIRCGRI